MINCSTATVENDLERDLFNCKECIVDNELLYNNFTKGYYCKYKYYPKYCTVKNCKICKNDNNFFCSVWSFADYEGRCYWVLYKKTKKIQEITLKDIYRFTLNDLISLNDREIEGPYFTMRFLNTSEINLNHAFFVQMIYLLKDSATINSNLEKSISIKTYCEIIDSTDKIDQVKIVVYNYFGDVKDKNLNNYKFNGIASNISCNEVKINNFEQTIKETNFDQIENKKKSEFSLEILSKYVMFKIDKESKKQYYNSNKFNNTIQWYYRQKYNNH